MEKSYKRILVPLDGSRLAEQALEDVKAVVSDKKASLITLLRVVEPLLKGYLVDYINIQDYQAAERRNEAEAKEYLLNIAEEMMRAGWRVEVELVVGGAADEAILDYVEEKKFDLIVMTTHGRSGVHRWIFGNVAQRVLRHSLIPVLIVPPTGFRNH